MDLYKVEENVVQWHAKGTESFSERKYLGDYTQTIAYFSDQDKAYEFRDKLRSTFGVKRYTHNKGTKEEFDRIETVYAYNVVGAMEYDREINVYSVNQNIVIAEESGETFVCDQSFDAILRLRVIQDIKSNAVCYLPNNKEKVIITLEGVSDNEDKGTFEPY